MVEGSSRSIHEPRIEAKIAFIMKQDLSGADASAADVVAATDHVAPALEILDTRIFRADPDTGAQRIVLDTISTMRPMPGLFLAMRSTASIDVDLRWVGAVVRAMTRSRKPASAQAFSMIRC